MVLGEGGRVEGRRIGDVGAHLRRWRRLVAILGVDEEVCSFWIGGDRRVRERRRVSETEKSGRVKGRLGKVWPFVLVRIKFLRALRRLWLNIHGKGW